MMDLSKLSDEELMTLARQTKINTEVLHTRQNTFKTLNNSLYGALGSVYFRWYDVFFATAITLSGYAGINVASNGVNQFISSQTGIPGDYVVASDTDSMYVDITKLVKSLGWDQLPDVVDKIDQFAQTTMHDAIGNVVTKFNNETNALTHRLYFKRESIASGLVIAKKRYVFLVYDNEGVRYATPELKVTGLETRRSSTPAWCRDRLESAFMLFFHGTEKDLWKFVKETREFYDELPLESIASASSANNLGKFTGGDGLPIKGTPAHIKGALYFNNYIKKKGLVGVNPILSGDKIKVLMLKEPNPIGNDALAFVDKFPQEIQIDEYVDRSAMFDKFFQTPLERVAEVRKWSCVRRPRLL